MKGSEIDVKLDNKYLNKYKKNMLKIMKDIFWLMIQIDYIIYND